MKKYKGAQQITSCHNQNSNKSQLVTSSYSFPVCRKPRRNWLCVLILQNGAQLYLSGNVADMSRHVGDDTTCRSNFGQMGPCHRHKIEDVGAVCVGLSRHLPDFPKCVWRNILWFESTYAKKNRHNTHPTSTSKKRENTHYSFTIRYSPSSSAHASYKGYGCNNAKPPRPPHRNTITDVVVGGPVEKMSFFQIVHMTKVNTQIHSSISQYDVYKVSSKKMTIT
jgi:hypothetical protein